MKRLITALSFFAVLLSLTACGVQTGSSGAQPSAPPSPVTETVVEVVTVPVTELTVGSGDALPAPEELAEMKSLKTLDLRAHDVTAGYVRAIREALPDCRILWNVPLTDGAFPNESVTLTLPNATEADVDLFDAFKNLGQVDATGSTAYAALFAFAQSHPGIEVRYSLELDGVTLRDSDASLTVPEGSDFTALKNALPFFPDLKTLDLRESGLDDAAAAELCALLPDVEILRLIPIGTERFDSASETLDLRALSGLSEDALIEALRGFSGLQTVAAPQNWTAEQTAKLTAACPGVRIVGAFSAFGRELDGAAEEIDLSGTKIEDPAEVEKLIGQAPFLKKLVLCDCGLTDVQMCELCDAHPGLKLVWIIHVGPHKLRTDATGFSTKNPSKHTNPNASEDYNNKVKNTKRLNEGDLALLKYCTDLEALDVGHNYLTDSDLEVIAGLTKLKVLILADNKITDISALTTLKDLEYIELFMNRIPDLSPLTEMPNLIDVNVCNTGVTDLTPLFELKNAKRLWYSMNPFDREQAKALKESLPDCLCVYTGHDETGDGWREDPRYQWMRAFFR